MCPDCRPGSGPEEKENVQQLEQIKQQLLVAMKLNRLYVAWLLENFEGILDMTYQKYSNTMW